MIKAILFAGVTLVAAHGGNDHHDHVHSAKGRTLLQSGKRICHQEFIKANNQETYVEASEEGSKIYDVYASIYPPDASDARVGEFETFEIPLVFHVLNQESCTDAHINANVAQMNKDFNMQADMNLIPDEFKGSVGNPGISFRVDDIIRKPNVSPQSGTTWTDKDCEMVKASPPKNPLKFMNIYIVNLDSGLLGYAFFPPATPTASNPLNFMVMAGGTIGGPNVKGAFTGVDIGRTLAHEVGHFLGLEHTFGDADTCKSDDGFSDTPKTTQNQGCPEHPLRKCGNVVQSMNYMDYVDDKCMNMFTKQQATKMRSVLDRDIGQRRCLGDSRKNEGGNGITPLHSICDSSPPAICGVSPDSDGTATTGGTTTDGSDGTDIGTNAARETEDEPMLEVTAAPGDSESKTNDATTTEEEKTDSEEAEETDSEELLKMNEGAEESDSASTTRIIVGAAAIGAILLGVGLGCYCFGGKSDKAKVVASGTGLGA